MIITREKLLQQGHAEHVAQDMLNNAVRDALKSGFSVTRVSQVNTDEKYRTTRLVKEVRIS